MFVASEPAGRERCHALSPGGPNAIAIMTGIVGDEWTLWIVQKALNPGITRYNEWLRAGPISSSVLTSRLASLVDDRVLERVAYTAHPPRIRLPAHPARAAAVADPADDVVVGAQLGARRQAPVARDPAHQVRTALRSGDGLHVLRRADRRPRRARGSRIGLVVGAQHPVRRHAAACSERRSPAGAGRADDGGDRQPVVGRLAALGIPRRHPIRRVRSADGRAAHDRRRAVAHVLRAELLEPVAAPGPSRLGRPITSPRKRTRSSRCSRLPSTGGSAGSIRPKGARSSRCTGRAARTSVRA